MIMVLLILPCTSGHRKLPCTSGYSILLCTSEDHIFPCTSADRIMPCTSGDRILPCTSRRRILPCTSADRILPCTSGDRILPCTSGHRMYIYFTFWSSRSYKQTFRSWEFFEMMLLNICWDLIKNYRLLIYEYTYFTLYVQGFPSLIRKKLWGFICLFTYFQQIKSFWNFILSGIILK